MRRTPRLTQKQTASSVKDRENSVNTRTKKEVVEQEEAEVIEETGYVLEGVMYATYQEMVDAKRRRNQQVLMDSGLLTAAARVRAIAVKPQQRQTLGLKKRKSPDAGTVIQRRKSNRLAGIESDGMYVETESAGRFTVSASDAAWKKDVSGSDEKTVKQEPEYYRDRINDGATLSVREAVEYTGAKWLEENSVSRAEVFVRGDLSRCITRSGSRTGSSLQLNKKKCESNVPKAFKAKVQALTVDDETSVAKVTPDRIYGIAAHPSSEKLIVCAGDKTGYVGIWMVDSANEGESVTDNHLFRFHKGAASCLQWTGSGSALFSASYDGSMRCFDVASESSEQIFATYDSQAAFKGELGYKMDTGYSFWTQYACLDNRFNTEKCFFVSTSIGTAMHIDLRASGGGRVTFHEELSEKKINTLSIHPDGHSLLSAGLDCTVKLWDLRKFEDNRVTNHYRSPTPLASYNCGRSVNSAYFSPSGRFVVSTTMTNKLDLFDNLHQASETIKPSRSIHHDNMTGRWLSTFMANWHPEMDVFVVGSMRRPRCVEVFDSQGQCLHAVSGNALTAVASRCCFHPSTDNITVVGGNSSGRVTIIR